MAISVNDINGLINFDEGLVSPEVFHDRDLYELESRRLFMRAWLFVAHESMIPKRGDFVSTYMGQNPVLVTRQRDGGISVMLNACRHRGMKVCRADAGNTRAFTCTFHGWAYDLDGSLASVPMVSEGYHNELNRDEFGLVRVAKVQTYKGLIFATFDADAPELLDYLGEAAWYLDALVDRREGGIEVLGGVHKIMHTGNWKMGAEQFAGDNYHAFLTHTSAMMSWRDMENDSAPGGLRPGFQFTSRGGHGLAGWRAHGPDDAPGIPSSDFDTVARYYRDTAAEVRDRLGSERVDGPSMSAATIFPNFSYLSRVFAQSSIGVWHPKSPGTFEYWRYAVVDRAAPPEVKAAVMRNMHVWPLGVADADDGENWSEISANMESPAVRDTMLNYQMGRGHTTDAHPQFPGTITESYIAEESHRSFYRRWQEFMAADSYPHLPTTTAADQTSEVTA